MGRLVVEGWCKGWDFPVIDDLSIEDPPMDEIVQAIYAQAEESRLSGVDGGRERQAAGTGGEGAPWPPS